MPKKLELYIPDNITVQASGPTQVIYPPAITKFGRRPVTVHYSKASGSIFPIGETQVTVKAVDKDNYTVSGGFIIRVDSAPPPITLQIVTPSVASGQLGIFYSQQLIGSGGVLPYSWALTGGALPNGVSLNGDTLQGTPTQQGNFNFQIRLQDNVGTQVFRNYTLTIDFVTLLISNNSPLSDALQNSPYSEQFEAANGTGPFTWQRIAGAFPTGMNMNAAGLYSGTPTVVQTANFTLRVTDALGNTGTKAFEHEVFVAGAFDTYYEDNGTFGGRPEIFTVGGSRRLFRLDNQNQINQFSQGGASSGNAYDPVYNACRLTIPTWTNQIFILAAQCNPGDTSIRVNIIPPAQGAFTNGKGVKIGTEQMIKDGQSINNGDGTFSFPVTRGLYGPQLTHAAGSNINIGTNSLPGQVRVPINTIANQSHRYVIAWDCRWSSLFATFPKLIPAPQKSWQFASDGIWWESRMKYDGRTTSVVPGFNPNLHVGAIDVRSYNQLGGTVPWANVPPSQLLCSDIVCSPVRVTDNSPVQPMSGQFIIFPERWTRIWEEVETGVNNYTPISLWIADEVQNPVQIYDRIPTTMRHDSNPPFVIDQFYHEFNTSEDDLLRPNGEDLQFWVRGPGILIDPPLNWAFLRVKPF